MATSTLGHYVRFGESALDGLDPIDSGMAGRVLGNLNHIADQYAQRRIAWVSHGDFVTYDPDETIAEDAWGHIWTSCPFDLHVRDDQTSYRSRVRLRAATEDSFAVVSFRAALCPTGEGEETMYANDAASVASTGAISSTTHAWYDAASLLYLDTRLTARATRSVATIDSVGGDEVSARWLRVQLSVWASYSWSGVAQSTTPPRLSGVEFDEYYTP